MNIQEVISLIESGHAPDHLSIDLSWNHIDPEGVRVLADAIQSGRAPDNLTLDLTGNRIGPEGVRAFAEAIQSDQSPAHLSINLGHNKKIDSDAVQVFREAIQSGQTSYGLRILGLDDDIIDLCEQSDTKKDRAFSLSLCHFFKSHEDNPLLEVELVRVTQDFAPKSKI